VLADDFATDNYLSTELRVPVTLLETNACSSLATNALAGDIWDNFSSHSYKSLPSVGKITVHHPITGAPQSYEMPAGGRGYIRPPSLVSLWSSAPFLLNNSLGDFYWSGSVPDRMKSFDSGIEQLLWPEKRKGDRKYMTASGKEVPGIIDVTSATSYLRVPKGYLPDFLSTLPAPSHLCRGFSARADRDRSDSQGHADQPAVQHRSRAKGQGASLVLDAKRDLKALPLARGRGCTKKPSRTGRALLGSAVRTTSSIAGTISVPTHSGSPAGPTRSVT
jgi:hypothetical protein